jgi:hypothetical protein
VLNFLSESVPVLTFSTARGQPGWQIRGKIIVEKRALNLAPNFDDLVIDPLREFQVVQAATRTPCFWRCGTRILSFFVC